jgi:copper chaperone NosL
MKTIASFLAILLCAISSVTLWAADKDIVEIPGCKYCGISRDTFNYSRMLIDYEDGTRVGLCSIHCTALDLALNAGKSIKILSVSDYGTTTLIDARKAVWVLGGNKSGVMMMRAKWAFADKSSAEAFIKVNRGTLVDFDQVMKSTFEDMYDDVKMISAKKSKMSSGTTNHDMHHHG